VQLKIRARRATEKVAAALVLAHLDNYELDTIFICFGDSSLKAQQIRLSESFSSLTIMLET
jgi:hypothetical protein